jgi:hypothetical protein
MPNEMDSHLGSPLGSDLLAAPRPAVYSDSDGRFEVHPDLHNLDKESFQTDIDLDDWLNLEIDWHLQSSSEVSNLQTPC